MCVRACVLLAADAIAAFNSQIVVMCGIFIDFWLYSIMHINIFVYYFSFIFFFGWWYTRCVYMNVYLCVRFTFTFSFIGIFSFLFFSSSSFPQMDNRHRPFSNLFGYHNEEEKKQQKMKHAHRINRWKKKKCCQRDRITNDDYCFFLKTFPKRKKERKMCRKKEKEVK